MKHININTQIKTSIKIACTLFLVSIMYSCNVKEVLTDANGQKKSLVLFNPNFLLTNYQVRIFDSANNFLNKEMVVQVLSNKKIVNEEGYFKNSFKVTNGILNFSVDPNEVISAASPIKLKIIIQAEAFGTSQIGEINYIGKNNFDRIFVTKIDNINNSAVLSASRLSNSNGSEKKSLNVNQLARELFQIGDNEIPIYLDKNNTITSPTNSYGEPTSWNTNIVKTTYSEDFSSAIITANQVRILKRDLPIKFTYRNIVDKNTMSYKLSVMFFDEKNLFCIYTIYSDGSTNLFKGDLNTYEAAESNTPALSNWDGIVRIPAKSYIIQIQSFSTRFNTELKDCPEGFNFNFNDIPKGATPEIGFVTYRNDINSSREFISNIGIAKVNQENPIHNTGELLYSNIKNKVVFQENSQYVVSPSTIELTGRNACGSTSNIKIIPKANLDLYKLAVQIKCEEDNFGVVANANVLFRKKGTSNWEGLTINNGIANLYLEKNAVYEVKGSYGDKKFEFNFTNDPSKFEEQKNESLNKNKDLKYITYKIKTSPDNFENKILFIDVQFFQTACPIN